MRTLEHQADLCVVGGGLAGVCAAVAAARHGARVVLMQDRPVLGGNASSEIRMWVCGAHGEDNRETGILEEICLENCYRNPSFNFSIWDSVLHGMILAEPNITLLLNCSCTDGEMEDGRLASVKGWQLTTQTWHQVRARWFADCSGDSILAPITGAEFRYGREAADEFGEDIEPKTADACTMGMSCLIQVRETESAKPFTPPDWAYDYPDEASLPPCRDHSIHDTSNFWWIELGGTQDCIQDTEELRDELLKVAFGVWDHVKNHGDHGAENWELDWVGFLPGKRESRRYVGEHIITQNDVRAAGKHFDDIIGYGGWTMDDHQPLGFAYYDGYPNTFHPAPSPWGIPFRALYSKNVKNLLFAGRNISATHAALSSSRVMATCAVLGQAVGTAAALMLRTGTEPRTLDIRLLQQTLRHDDCYLPFTSLEPPELTRLARANPPEVLSGTERGPSVVIGREVRLEFDTPQRVEEVRLILDSDLNRPPHNMRSNYPLHMEPNHVPETLLKAYRLVGEGPEGETVLAEVRDNRRRLALHQVGRRLSAVRLIPLETWGCNEFRLYTIEVS